MTERALDHCVIVKRVINSTCERTICVSRSVSLQNLQRCISHLSRIHPFTNTFTAPDWHCYGGAGYKNLRGWIIGNTLCKLPWPEAPGLYTPLLPLSFTSSLHVHSRAKSVKNWISKFTALIATGCGFALREDNSFIF